MTLSEFMPEAAQAALQDLPARRVERRRQGAAAEFRIQNIILNSMNAKALTFHRYQVGSHRHEYRVVALLVRRSLLKVGHSR